MSIRSLVEAYFEEVDIAVEILSNKHESAFSQLMPWVLAPKRIQIALIETADLYIVMAERRDDLDEDYVTEITVNDSSQLQLEGPWVTFKLEGRYKNYVYWLGPMEVQEADNKFAQPSFLFAGTMAWVSRDRIAGVFSVESARKMAVDIWNASVTGLQPSDSFMACLQSLINRLRDLSKRKGFKERKIHRFINENATIFLPDHERCFFEHHLYLGGETRKADFILQRSEGQPALLIELESPVHKVFTKRGDYTSEVNHARGQMDDWVRFISENSENVKGEMAFLGGPLDRLVVIGKHLENYDRMLNSRYGDTLIWTYEVLAKTTVTRWNRVITEQCKLLGMSAPEKLY